MFIADQTEVRTEIKLRMFPSVYCNYIRMKSMPFLMNEKMVIVGNLLANSLG